MTKNLALEAALAVLVAGCTVALDFGDECKTSADCADKGDAVRCVQGLCVTDLGLTSETLLTAPCSRMYGVTPEQYLANPYRHILLGTLLPATGQLEAYGPPIDKAVETAVKEINMVGGILGTKLAVLSCDSGTDPELAKSAATHMAAMGIPAMVGAAASSITIEVFNEVAKPNGMVMVSPASTAPSITATVDDGLLWRTAPSDAVQGAAMARALISQELKKVAVVFRDDAYGLGFRDAINEYLCTGGEFDCKEGLFTRAYTPEPVETMKAAQADVIANMLTFAPEAVVLVAFVEDGVAFMKAAADNGFDRFILTDGLKSNEVITSLEADYSDVLCKAMGTNPADPDGEAYSTFEINYTSQVGKAPGAFTAHAYDALYALAYAAAAANKKPEELTGADFAAGLRRLTGGKTVIPVGTKSFNEGVALLHNDTEANIDFEGASGKLEFDNEKGEPKTTAIEGWYFNLEKKEVESLGVLLTAEGAYTAPTGLPECGATE